MQGGEESRRKGIAILPHPFAWPDRRRSLPTSIFWILLLAVGLRALAWVRIDPVAFDSAVYFEMADLIRAGRWLEAPAYPYPPLYPLLVAALQGLGLGAESAGLFIALAADLLVLFPLVALTRLAVGETAAWGAAFLWAIHPSAIRLGVQALTDAPTALLVAIALWAGLRALDECRPWWAVGGCRQWTGLSTSAGRDRAGPGPRRPLHSAGRGGGTPR
jgi:4-amino-4-deoxy-L-arabinose transferase-like glycosyltransferase